MNEIKEAFFSGTSLDSHQYFGAHFVDDGVIFRLYAPHAKEVEIKGSFTSWSGLKMNKIDERGIYELYLKNINEYDKYFYNILTFDNKWIEKSDPYAFFCEKRPSQDCKVFNLEAYEWNDNSWLLKRNKNFEGPLNIYEIHLGSFIKIEGEEFIDYERLAPLLCDYLIKNGYNFVELMPIMEHPLDKSWGYQISHFFAASSRYGNPRQLMYLIDYLHKHNIGVILDFVCVHFASDGHGLLNFDGKEVYAYDNEFRFSQWGSPNFNLGSEIVRSFLMSSISLFLEKFHFDGLRIDAVNNIIYHDGNSQKGYNEGGIEFLKRMNHLLSNRFKEVMLIAEDSSSHPKVCGRVEDGCLGFDYKWDMGWMNDTLRYFEMDPIYRKYNHNLITFSMHYYFSERFLLPLSHDEVVHGKKSIVNKMWGDYDQKFAQARLLYGYMFTHPGKKLNFMGNELGQFIEWDEKRSLDWFLLDYPKHAQFNRYFKDLNHIYLHYQSLHKSDYLDGGFKWMMVDNNAQSVFTYYRHYQNEYLVTILNMTPNYYHEYEIGVPLKGVYEIIIHSDNIIYGGNTNNYGTNLAASKKKMHNQEYSVKLTLPGLSFILLRRLSDV